MRTMRFHSNVILHSEISHSGDDFVYISIETQ